MVENIKDLNKNEETSKVKDEEQKDASCNDTKEETLEKETKETSSKPSKEDKKKKKSREEIQIEALKAELNKLRDERTKEHESFLMARADLENVRRRVQEDAIQERKYFSMGIVSDLINPVDMLVKASNMETDDIQMKNFLIGFQMIANQIIDILKRDGLAEIEAKGKEFDPNFHQAISKEHVDGVEAGQVIEVLQTGYKYKDRIIKPAMVKVSE